MTVCLGEMQKVGTVKQGDYSTTCFLKFIKVFG